MACSCPILGLITNAKKEYYGDVFNTHDQRAIFKGIGTLLKVSEPLQLPSSGNKQLLCEEFHSYFDNKTSKIHQSIAATLLERPVDNVHPVTSSVVSPLNTFSTITTDQIRKFTASCPPKTCILDPLPTGLLKEMIDVHIEPLTAIINQSLQKGVFQCF